MLSGAKVLVTGATGQIGFPLSVALARDNEVWGMSRLSDPEAAARLSRAGITPFGADLAAGELDGLPTDFTHVLHLATFRRGGLDYDRAMQTNAEGTHLLYRHCQDAEAILVMSTAEVYRPQDDPRHVYVETDPLGDSNSAFDPTYSVSKIAEEAVARGCARAYGVPTVIARMNAAYGSGGGLLGMHLTAILSGQPVVVKWDPAMYSPIHDDDIAAQTAGVLGAAGVPATVLNWGGDEAVSAQEWCAYMAELAGAEADVVVREVPGGIRGIVFDVSRRLAAAGPCRVSWRDGVRRMVEHRLTAAGSGPNG